MNKIFSKICQQCGGECCHYDVFLSKSDLPRLGPFKARFKLRKNKAGFMTFLKKRGACPFLVKGKGCVLPENKKPLDCRLFPLAFLYKSRQIRFYANKDCTFLEKIPETWVKRTKKRAANELRLWTEQEKRSFSRYVEGRKDLIPV